jgi:hypothetical protein
MAYRFVSRSEVNEGGNSHSNWEDAVKLPPEEAFGDDERVDEQARSNRDDGPSMLNILKLYQILEYSSSSAQGIVALRM